MTDYDRLFERMTGEPGAELSPTGRARRDAMRAHLVGEVSHRRRRRTVVRVGAIAALVAIAVVVGRGLVDDARDGEPDTPQPVPTVAGETADPGGIAIVRDDESILARVAATADRSVTTVDDDELLRLLASADRPTGLVRSGNRVMLTRHVADPLTPRR